MIAVVDSGSGNLRSVEKALAAVGGKPVVTSDPEQVLAADQVVVPGQGAFRDCVRALAERGLDAALREVIRRGTPFLGICLGLQLLFEESEEQGRWPGLGVLRGRVVRFATGALKIPHMGWNRVYQRRAEPLWRGLPDGAHAYFVHSFYAVPSDPDDVVLEAEYGLRFCAAVRRDNVVAVQFHPEKSQAVGLTLLTNFVRS